MKEEEEEEEEEEEQDFFKTKNERRRKAFWVVSLTNPSRRQGVHRLAFHRLAFLGGHCSKFTILCDGLLVVLVELAQEANFHLPLPALNCVSTLPLFPALNCVSTLPLSPALNRVFDPYSSSSPLSPSLSRTW
jgi:hypothetical protein